LQTRPHALTALALIWTFAFACACACASPKLRLVGSELVVEDGENRVRGPAVKGARITLPGLGELVVSSAMRDHSSRFGDVWLYELSGPDGSICHADSGGDTRLVFFPGYFDHHRRYRADHARISLSCVAGVQAKCLRWGYAPWQQAPTSGESLAPYFEACLQLTRADYCADDRPQTREGTAIDIYDRVGVQQPLDEPGRMSFEAGWTPLGAVCVHHTRISERLATDQVSKHCPRLDGKVGLICSESRARESGALLYNRSEPNR